MRSSAASPRVLAGLLAGVAGCGTGAGGQAGVKEIVVPAVPAATGAAASGAPSAAAEVNEGETAETVDDEAKEEAAEFGMIGLLNPGAGPDPDAATSPWRHDSSLDDGSAKGGVFGARTGDVGGFGLGSVGTGLRLGGSTVGASTVAPGAVQVSGRLPPEVIQRIARTNLGRYRLCYENGLRKNPHLQGWVRVRFVIGRDGAVSTVSNGGSDVPDAEVVSCVLRSFYGLAFPQPEGGIVTVLYPISFAPGAAPAAPAPAPAPKP